eukprot:s3147_g17.t1
MRKKGMIFEMEAPALMIGATQLLHPLALRPCDRVVVFIDNEAVLARVVSGKAGLSIDQAIFQTILEWEFSASAVMWFERVPSHANVADAPSRNVLSGLDVRLQINLDPTSVVKDIVSRFEADRHVQEMYQCLYQLIDVEDSLEERDAPAALASIRHTICLLRRSIADMSIYRLRLLCAFQRQLRIQWHHYRRVPSLDLEI